MFHRVPTCAAVLFVAFLSGCAQYTLVMTPKKEFTDEGSRSPQLAQKTFSKVLIAPPAKGEFSSYQDLLARFETAFLRSEIGLVSSFQSADLRVAAAKIDEGGAALASAVKAIQDAGVEAVVAVSMFEWSPEKTPTRFFTLDPNVSTVFEEVDETEYRRWSGPKYSFSSSVLSFDGKIVDAESKEIMAIFRVRAPANFNLPAEYTARMKEVKGEYEVESENWTYDAPDWDVAARAAIEDRVAEMVAAALKSGGGEVEIETAPAETAPAETTPPETTPAGTTPPETTPAGTTPAGTTPAKTP